MRGGMGVRGVQWWRRVVPVHSEGEKLTLSLVTERE